jgi:hypothetical protein
MRELSPFMDLVTTAKIDLQNSRTKTTMHQFWGWRRYPPLNTAVRSFGKTLSGLRVLAF